MKYKIEESRHTRDGSNLTVLSIGAISLPMGNKAKINEKTYKIKFKSSNASVFVDIQNPQPRRLIYIEGLYNFKRNDEVEI